MARMSGARNRGPRRAAQKGSVAQAGLFPAVVESTAMVSEPLRRFPWPANPRQRYSYESPYLAVVNARGPWSVWRHGAANPPFIPLYLDLFDKGFWRAADNGQRIFAITVWARAAREDEWGIVWGDPVRMVHEWGLDAATLVARLDWMIEMGLACYLTHAEAAAARSWRAYRGKVREGEGGSKRGEEQGASKFKQGQEQARAKQEQEPAPVSQAATSARAPTDSQLPGQPQGQEQARQEQDQTQGQPQAKAKHSTARPQTTQEASQAANLPESDQGTGNGSQRLLEPAGGLRSPSALSGSEAVRIGQVLSAKQIAWQNPLAVDFARHMVGAITGRPCNEDLNAAGDRLLMDLGPWVYYWVEHVQNSLNGGHFEAFRARCVKDIVRKKRCRGVKNLGGLARSEIVPGVLRAMAKGGD